MSQPRWGQQNYGTTNRHIERPLLIPLQLGCANKEAVMQKVQILSLTAVGLAVCCEGLMAQQQLPATTVQLPSFSIFSVNTTVSVPDRGGMYLGGVNRARDGSTSRGFGPFANRGIGGDRMASGVSVQATIIDHDELDRAVLAEAAARRTPAGPDDAKAALLSRHIGRDATCIAATSGRAPGGSADSVAAIRAKNAAAADERASEAAAYFAQGQQAEADGKPGVARIYYQLVVRRDVGPLKQQAELRLAAMAHKATAVAKR